MPTTGAASGRTVDEAAREAWRMKRDDNAGAAMATVLWSRWVANAQRIAA
jgi:hypothetical protein